MNTYGVSLALLDKAIEMSSAIGQNLTAKPLFCVISLEPAASSVQDTMRIALPDREVSRAWALGFVRSRMAEMVTNGHAVKLGVATWNAGPFCQFANMKWAEYNLALCEHFGQIDSALDAAHSMLDRARMAYSAAKLFTEDMPF
jgi:hypothetical protein